MKEQIIKHLESVADEFEVDMSDAIDLINELDEELISVFILMIFLLKWFD